MSIPATLGVAGGTLCVVSSAASIAGWRLLEQVNFVNRIACNTATSFDYELFQVALVNDESLRQLARMIQNTYERCGCGLPFATTRARRLKEAMRRVLIEDSALPPRGPPILPDDQPPPSEDSRRGQRERNGNREQDAGVALLTDENFRRSGIGRALIRDIQGSERAAAGSDTNRQAVRGKEKPKSIELSAGASSSRDTFPPISGGRPVPLPSQDRRVSSQGQGKSLGQMEPEVKEHLDRWYAASIAGRGGQLTPKATSPRPSTSDQPRPHSPPAQSPAPSRGDSSRRSLTIHVSASGPSSSGILPRSPRALAIPSTIAEATPSASPGSGRPGGLSSAPQVRAPGRAVPAAGGDGARGRPPTETATARDYGILRSSAAAVANEAVAALTKARTRR